MNQKRRKQSSWLKFAGHHRTVDNFLWLIIIVSSLFLWLFDVECVVVVVVGLKFAHQQRAQTVLKEETNGKRFNNFRTKHLYSNCFPIEGGDDQRGRHRTPQ